jgi:transglutaminase-like putative cysteine protease
VTYRITVKGDDDPTTTFAHDERQEAGKAKGQTFDLTVRSVREPGTDKTPAADEYLASSAFVTSDDAEVMKLAAKAVGAETDPWKKACLIEKYVHEHMTGSTDVGFATAAQIARNLKGDCRQHALLTAAMCRAAKIPSRTALGLVYVNHERGPFLGFHMWTEVYVGGKWLGIDAVLGQGGIGPGHLKVNDHSWADTQSLGPLLPVTRVMGKVTVEIVDVK